MDALDTMIVNKYIKNELKVVRSSLNKKTNELKLAKDLYDVFINCNTLEDYLKIDRNLIIKMICEETKENRSTIRKILGNLDLMFNNNGLGKMNKKEIDYLELSNDVKILEIFKLLRLQVMDKYELLMNDIDYEQLIDYKNELELLREKLNGGYVIDGYSYQLERVLLDRYNCDLSVVLDVVESNLERNCKNYRKTNRITKKKVSEINHKIDLIKDKEIEILPHILDDLDDYGVGLINEVRGVIFGGNINDAIELIDTYYLFLDYSSEIDRHDNTHFGEYIQTYRKLSSCLDRFKNGVDVDERVAGKNR